MAFLLHHILSESARRLSDKEAVRFDGESITYKQLDALSNQVAKALQSGGVRRGDRVGIYVHKSMASVVSVFGIMKAGGVYVPLDPSAPVKRLAYITRNCDIRVLLTSAEMIPSLAEFFIEGTPLETMLLTGGGDPKSVDVPKKTRMISWAEVRARDDEPIPDVGAIETDLAYILYTSGSTGEPKGVMISHRTIFTFVNWCYETFGLTSTDRVTSHAPLHFDLSTFDIYVTIKAGGTVVLVPEQLSIYPIRVADFLQSERITITYLVPSVLSLMVNYGKLADHAFSTLRAILFAGEVFPLKYLRQLVAAIPQAEFYNLYGPTETNVCTYYKVQPEDLTPEKSQPVPIGVACRNMEVFAVDDHGVLVTQPGQRGELWARGSGVAQGYWGNPEATRERFVRNSFQSYFSEVAYRTGDIVMLAEDGVNWLYVGRCDHMIKSRGYRIELGEIESAFHSHDGVKEVAVVAVADELVGNRIRAFIAPLEGHCLTPQDLKAHCSRLLPSYMVPEIIEVCDGLPKTSTGKINRSMLASV